MRGQLNILKQSPLDGRSSCTPASGAEGEDAVRRWVPSRFNLRTTNEAGQLILWNSFKGSLSIFPAEQKETILRLLQKRGVVAPKEGAVKYLADRGVLVPEGTDEYQRFQFTFGSYHYRNDVLELILLASEDCNFRCKYCYENFSHGTMGSEVRARIKTWVESRAEHLRHLEIGWFGGEPLYGWDAIRDLAPFFQELVEEHSLSFRSNMTTNGYLLTPEIVRQLLDWKVNEYQITVDGVPEDHDQSRPTREGGASFQQIFDNLKAMRELPDEFEVDIRVNFAPANLPRLSRFLDLVEEEFRGDERFRLRFRPVGKWGGENDHLLEVTGFDEGARVQRELELESARRGLCRADPFPKMSRFRSQVCYAARPTHFVIGARGQVMKCTVALDEPFNQVGEVMEDGTLRLDESKLAQWTEPAFERDSTCQRCVVLPVCQGVSCPLRRVRSQERPCIPTRSQWKECLLTEAALATGARKTFVREG